MYYTLTLNSRGQVTIPKALREFLGVKPGSKVQIRAKDNQVTIQKTLDFDEMMDNLAALRATFSDETKAAIKRNAGKTVRELRAIAEDSPETLAYYKRKYFTFDDEKEQQNA